MADIHPFAIVAEAVILGERVKVWQFATVCAGTIIGSDCVIGSGAWIGHDCRIGDGVRIQHGAFIPSGTAIAAGAFIGPNVTMTDDRYPRAGNRDYAAEPPVIGEGASIGAGAVILPGVTVGARAMVGAGAVVTRDVSADDTVKGNPARLKLVVA